MKNLIIKGLFLLALGITLPALAAYNDTSSSSDSTSNTATSNPGGSDTSPVVHGVIVSVDSEGGNFVVTDAVSGSQQTYTANNKSDLKDLKNGDKVTITTQKDNPNNAKKVEKSSLSSSY